MSENLKTAKEASFQILNRAFSIKKIKFIMFKNIFKRKNTDLNLLIDKEIMQNKQKLKEMNKPFISTFKNEDERQKALEALMQKVKNKDTLTEKETYCFCSSLKKSRRNEFEICDEYRFYSLYMTIAIYEKAPTNPLNRYTQYVDVLSSKKELEKYCEDWKKKIYSDKPDKDRLYVEIRKEAKDFLKKIRKEEYPEKTKLRMENDIILRSKFFYIKAKRIISNLSQFPINSNLCGYDICLDEATLVHILFRHYSEITKPYNDDRSYIPYIFPVEFAMNKLKEIIDEIEESKLLNNTKTQNIFFRYLGTLYRIYFKEVGKSTKEKGNYKIHILRTFYPVEAEKDLKASKLLKEKRINKKLQVLVSE